MCGVSVLADPQHLESQDKDVAGLTAELFVPRGQCSLEYEYYHTQEVVGRRKKPNNGGPVLEGLNDIGEITLVDAAT